MLLRYPIGDREHDYEIVAKRGGLPRYGDYGVVIYYFRAALEFKHEADVLYHPVDNKEEATHWISYYENKMTVVAGMKNKTYHRVHFQPTPSYVKEQNT